MTLLLRDEEDILRANIDFHRSQGVDFFIATDNRSEDSTPEILRDYERQGVLHYIFEGTDDYNQSAWVTRMARLAATDYDADWVINNDADEFWWPMEGSLKSTFEKVAPEINAVVGQRRNFVPVAPTGRPFWSDMVYKEKLSLNAAGNPLPPKVAHRAYAEVVVPQGNHDVANIGDVKYARDTIEILHFPLRTYAQFENKIIKGGQAYERNEVFDKGVGATWRRLYAEHKQGKLMRHYKREEFSPLKLRWQMLTGKLVRDDRLAEFCRSANVAA